MAAGICNLSMIPVRKEASHQSEMVSQLLFGESYTILETQNDWARICMNYDGYEGFISSGQLKPIEDEEFNKLLLNDKNFTLDVVQVVYNTSRNFTQGIFIGSSLPQVENETFSLAGEIYLIKGLLSKNIPEGTTREMIIEENIRKFIQAPYLWGGRTPFGIDCSGLVQIIYKLCGIKLPRDASEQSKLGETIYFINDAKPGDLMFFDNQEQQITHTGIYLGNNQIVHSSGWVKIDDVDTTGIFNKDKQIYTHNLRVIKRV